MRRPGTSSAMLVMVSSSRAIIRGLNDTSKGDQANDIFKEIIARENLLGEDIDSVTFVYNLVRRRY